MVEYTIEIEEISYTVELCSVSPSFTSLTDTPSSYSGQAGKTVTVNTGEDGLEFSSAGAGDMTKAVYDTGNIEADCFARANHTGTQTASTISDFDTEVANNTAVTANTAKVTNATHTGDVTGSEALTVETFSQTVNATNNTLDNAKTVQFNSELDNGSKTTDATITWNNAQKQKVTLTANTITLTLDNPTSVGNFLLKIVNGGLATLTWAATTGSVYFPGGTDPSLTSSGTDIVSFYYDGINFYGVGSLDFS
jgi:hypothetical protein